MRIMSATLLSDIEEFLSETGMSPYRFGFESVKNGRLVERLREGRTPGGKTVRVWPDTEAQIRAYMRLEKSRSSTRAEA